ncbi:hypothetical protein K440DRAFT_240652 [Wilcoxina mikolae CBS 423.85]|nr:hypothetical protein K440DRAFT_240652 [Wilcoxina mikolae CBS 423.85]
MLAFGGSEGFLSDSGYKFELEAGLYWEKVCFLLHKQQQQCKCTRQVGAHTLYWWVSYLSTTFSGSLGRAVGNQNKKLKRRMVIMMNSGCFLLGGLEKNTHSLGSSLLYVHILQSNIFKAFSSDVVPMGQPDMIVALLLRISVAYFFLTYVWYPTPHIEIMQHFTSRLTTRFALHPFTLVAGIYCREKNNLEI